MTSKFTLLLSFCIAGGALWAGYRLKHPKLDPTTMAAVSLSQVSSFSLGEYLQQRGKTPEDYLTLDVRGCPPKAPAELLGKIEAVVDFRQCSGKALIPK